MLDYIHDYLDEYAKALATQNAGGVCKHCGSALGHYSKLCCSWCRSAKDVNRVNKLFALQDTRSNHGTEHYTLHSTTA